tara:strand:- start:5874 stop:6596 length:723 start_codon:yes stop_codon:yes gene_type:complete
MSKVIVDEIQTDTTNGNVRVIPNGSGALEVKGDGSSNDGALQLNCHANSHGVKLKSPPHSAGQSYTMILPDNQVAADKYLKVKSITGSGATAVGQLEYSDVTLPSTLTGSANLSGLLREGVKITAGTISGNSTIDLADGMVHYFTTLDAVSFVPNLRFNSSTTLNSSMSIGQTIAVTLIWTTAGNYPTAFQIDSSAVTPFWIGGSAPTAGGSSNVDILTFNVIKTADASFTVIANHSKTS